MEGGGGGAGAGGGGGGGGGGVGGGGGGGTALSLDCEDMFKEITKKLYGEEAVAGAVEFPAAERDPEQEGGGGGGVGGGGGASPEEHLTAWGLAALMQHGVPPPGILQPNFQPRTDPAAEDRWSAAEEPLPWAASRVAAYNPAQRLFKCAECECVGFLARVAEHWLGTHCVQRHWHCPLAACGYSAAWARAVRHHLARDHHADPAAADHLLRDNPALDDLTRYLTRLKTKVDAARNERRVEAPAPVVVQQQQQQQQQETVVVVAGGGTGAGAGVGAGSGLAGDGGKRYVCGACPYATDRRDLFTRHENIHRDEKPFHCYLCTKQFNRADHVKKHFLRMHRDQPYDLHRIRRQACSKSPPPLTAGPSAPATQPPAAPTHHYYVKPPPEPPPTLEYRVAPTLPPPVKLERAPLTKTEPAPPPPLVLPAPPQLQHKSAGAGGGGGAGGAGGAAQGAGLGARRKGERRYACCYCAWSGADNWCLKRHLNTHLKPFACALCEYKAARAERLATHVHKVHNKKACARCPFLADDAPALQHHLHDAHHIESRNLKVPGVSRASGASFQTTSGASSVQGAGGAPGGVSAVGAGHGAGGAGGGDAARRRVGAARLFGYLEASDGSGDEYDPPLSHEYPGEPAPAAPPHVSSAAPSAAAPSASSAGPAPTPPQHFPRDKENAAPLHHALHHDHSCLRY